MSNNVVYPTRDLRPDTRVDLDLGPYEAVGGNTTLAN